MNKTERNRANLRALADTLASRRDAILSAWRLAVDLDPELSRAASSTRTQFEDHIPDVLDAFESKLCADNVSDKLEARADQTLWSAEHGSHRWQQGYDLTETMREWGHLHLCLLNEIEHWAGAHSELEAEAIATARRELVRFASEGVSASAARYSRLQRIEAASRLHDLELALDDLRILNLERAESWRQAAHDLRGNAHIIANASAFLSRADLADIKRTEISEALTLASSSLNRLLTELLDHARLEAGEERRSIEVFDVAKLVKDYCETARTLASDRGLFLKCQGPDALVVEGDPVKVQRILQNLLLNALKVTEVGGVLVSWDSSDADAEAEQWALCIQDTGPGFRNGSSPFKRELKQVTDDAIGLERREPQQASPPLSAEPAPTLPSQTQRVRRPVSGEGIGLSIVKRLCELLEASIELQSTHGQGTTFRVIFPRRYPKANSS